MKYLSTLSMIALFTMVLLSACKNEGDAGSDSAVQNATPAAPAADVTAPTPAVTPPNQEPAQNAAGIWHYTCPKGCEGGAGMAIACAKCGTTLAHNQGYHTTNTEPNLTVGGNNQTTPAVTPPQQEPAQNAKGVWHYTCSKGCEGGAGSATACAKCGTTLAHNAAYHQ
jgi:ribosomal protein S27E